jgi:predicted nuclease of predicted toxin-antitoxin system
VKFLVDAQLPVRLARFLISAGHDVLHTTDLPDGNRTAYGRIAALAGDEDRVVVTKDRDFRDGHLLSRSPQRLLVVATGNITNSALLSPFEAHLDAILAALEEADFVELVSGSLVVHRRREDGPAC